MNRSAIETSRRPMNDDLSPRSGEDFSEDDLDRRGRRGPQNNGGGRAPARDAGAPAKEISTLYIVGFPDQALTRELKNLCRCFPGYEGSAIQNTGQKGGGQTSLFAKFSCLEDAEDAMAVLGDLPFDEEYPDQFKLKVQIARRDFDVSKETFNFSERLQMQPGESPTLMEIRQRKLGPERGGGKGAGKAGDRGGDRGDRGADRGDRGYVDERPQKRARADGAREDRVPRTRFAETGGARRDDDYGREDRGGRPRRAERDFDREEERAPRRRQEERGYDRGDRDRPGMIEDRYERNDRGDRDGGGRGRDRDNRRAAPVEDTGGIDTLAVLNMSQKGLSERKIQDVAGREPGFIKMHYVQKLDGYFIKYETPEDAGAALDLLNRKNIDAELARRNLELR